MKLYYSNTHGPNRKEVEKAITLATTLAQQNAFSEAAIAVPLKQGLIGNVVTYVIGSERAKSLMTSGYTNFKGCVFYLLTCHIDGPFFESGPVIAAFTPLPFLERLMEDPRATDIIYLPWMQEERIDFQRTNPQATLL